MTVDLAPFSLRRFAEGRPIVAPHPYATRPEHQEPMARGANPR
jgi:hypothetical protein